MAAVDPAVKNNHQLNLLCIFSQLPHIMTPTVSKNFHLLDALWRRWSGCHRKSRVENKMNCIKLLGQSVMARDFDRQGAETQVRIAVFNRDTTVGIPITEPVG